MSTEVTDQELDQLRHPNRIFSALLALPEVPAEQKLFVRRAQKIFTEGTLSKELYSSILSLAFQYGVCRHDLRPFIGEQHE